MLVALQVLLAALVIDGWVTGGPGPTGLTNGALVLGIAALAVLRRTACRSVPLKVRHYRHAFLALALACLVVLGFLQPFHVGSALATLGVAVVAHALFEGLMAADPPRRKGARLCGFLLFNAVFCLFGVEVGLRVIARRAPSVLLLPADAPVDQQIAAYRYRPGQVHFGFPCNAAGYYDEEVHAWGPDDTRVLAVGDSFNASTVPHNHHYTTVAERALDQVQVYNVGVSAAGPREYRRMIETLADTPPMDAILLCLFVGNDITDAQRGRRRHPWLRSWLDRDNLRWSALLERRELVGEVSTGRDAGTRLTIDGDRVVMQTEHGTLAGTRAQLIEMYPVLFPWLEDPSQETPTFSEAAFLDLERRRAVATCGPVGRTYEDFFESLRALLETCEGTPTYALLIPDQFQVEDGLWTAVSAASGVPDLDREQPQRLLAEFLGEQGIPVLDLLPAFQAALREDPARPLYLKRDTHFNAAGHRLAGELLAAFLRATLPGR